MRLTVVRHGQTEENKLGIIMGQNPGELSQEGITSTKQMAVTLRSLKIDYVFSSDLKRCIDTTNILLDGRDVDVVFDARLREINFGKYQGKPYSALSGDYTSDLNKKFPSGESNRKFAARVLDCINEIYAKHQNDTVLVVTHSGCISVILAAFYGMSIARALSELKIENATPLEIEISSMLEQS